MAPLANLLAEVRHREGQAEIQVKFRDMKPAILYGGDVTCYVVWAVNRDGTVENLGELWVRGREDNVDFSTGMKSFALMITLEPHPLVTKPSELVVFFSNPSTSKRAPSASFVFSGFAPAPKVGMDSIANIAWDTDRPLDLMQAEKAFELAERENAQQYAPQIFREARTALGQARAYGEHTSRTKKILDYSRRAVALASEAISTAVRRKEAEQLEREIEARRQEMANLEQRARDAEETAEVAKEQLEQAQLALAQARNEREVADLSILQTRSELAQLESDRARMRQEQAQLQAEQQALLEQKQQLQSAVAEMSSTAERLRQEREELRSRLESALSQVADTQTSARGFIVNLPDILFDLNEASLKAEAKVVLAKLAGILLLMPELNLRVEGHTDATGSDEYNQGLSERRAASVRDFLAAQGIGMGRMISVGYGEHRPVADNATKEGRQRNRRVEIVISEGVVQEAAAP
jgi:outer membrane protein OmpA-like peptidoglycan-associated protein